MRKPLARLVIPTGAAGVMLGVLAGGPAAPVSAVSVTISPTVPTGQCFVINPNTGLPLDTNCITSTPTPPPTATATATGTATPTPTATATGTSTATATATPTAMATPTGGGGTNLVLTPQEDDSSSTPTPTPSSGATVTTTPFANPSSGGGSTSTSTSTPVVGSSVLPPSAAPEVNEVAGSANQTTSPSAAAPLPPATGNGGMVAAGQQVSVLASMLGLVAAAMVAIGARLLKLIPKW